MVTRVSDRAEKRVWGVERLRRQRKSERHGKARRRGEAKRGETDVCQKRRSFKVRCPMIHLVIAQAVLLERGVHSATLMQRQGGQT